MKLVLFAFVATFLVANDTFAQADRSFLEKRFEGATGQDELCAFVLDARRAAETEGRLDFAAHVESVGGDASRVLIARISTGSPYAIRQIHFSGHRTINDTTLRRALPTFEREMFDVQRLRRGLAQISRLGVFEPLTLDDVIVNRLDDGVTVDLTIQLRERKARWWTLSEILLPGINPVRASIGSRLPAWGRGFFELATYFVSLNTLGFRAPFFALERAIVPGQEWLSGFAIPSSLSARAMMAHYARTHAQHSISGILDPGVDDPVTVDIKSAIASQPASLTCKPRKPRLWWLRAGVRQVLAIYGSG